MTPDDPRHGTTSGYGAHKRAGVEPCEQCRRANMRYMKAWRLAQQERAGVTVAAIGYQRRIAALRRLGWATDVIAKEAGVGAGTIHRLMNGTTRTVRTRTARRIDAAYKRLSGRPGPSTIAARHAIRAGSPPPLAWDDIDAANERPKGVRAA